MSFNRFDRAREVARLEALADAYKTVARERRAELDAEARAEWEANGCGVTWRMPDLGRVCLPLTEEAPWIADIDALLKWAKERHPENVETVEQVRAAFQKWLLDNVQITEGGAVVDPETGEVVPGMAVREGGQPKALTVTLDRDVKALFADYAKREVQRALAAEYGEAVAG